jgi:hypothetical protein
MRHGYWGANIDHRGRRRAPRPKLQLIEEQRKLCASYENEREGLISDHDLVESAVPESTLPYPDLYPD